MSLVIFVCTANMCRSAMAEGILRHRLVRDGVNGVEVESMGIYGRDREPAVKGAVEVCREAGIDLSGHRSRSLSIDRMMDAGVILTMEKGHFDFINQFFHVVSDRSGMLGAWPEAGGRKQDVKDPTGGSRKAYQQAFNEISGHIERIMPLILSMP